MYLLFYWIILFIIFIGHLFIGHWTYIYWTLDYTLSFRTVIFLQPGTTILIRRYGNIPESDSLWTCIDKLPR